MSNHVSRFHDAVSVIVSHGNMKQRLVSAFEEHLALIEDEELPEVIRERFAALKRRMTGIAPLNGEGHIRATVRKMSMAEADECSRCMLEIYTEMLRREDDRDEARPIRRSEKPTRVPPFLVKTLNS
ncbi:MAG: hypothetical protein OEV41_07600 [Gammaproteobacteria bacterium]|nr:hypothetical protein [Gammaproteobacteria bacterium]MDH5345792.1 hypothetical protein [Gammaproteobacteria bacterium]